MLFKSSIRFFLSFLAGLLMLLVFGFFVDDPARAEDAASPSASEGEVSSPIVLRSRFESELQSDRTFGRYRLGLGFLRPAKTSGKEVYEKFYGPMPGQASFAVEYYPFGSKIAAGVRGAVGYLSDSGYASKTPMAQGYERDMNSRLSLSVTPVQIGLAAQATPFAKKWVVLSGWFGWEKCYYQEARRLKDSTSSTSLASTDTESTSTSTKSYLNSGSTSGINYGAAVNISMSPISEGTANLMRDTMGLNEIYVSPFFEATKMTSTAAFDFSRTAIGVAFIFESTY